MIAFPMIAFLVTNFDGHWPVGTNGHWPVGTSAVVYAEDREQCKRVLRAELLKRGLGKDDPDQWTISPLTPVSDVPRAVVVQDGNY